MLLLYFHYLVRPTNHPHLLMALCGGGQSVGPSLVSVNLLIVYSLLPTSSGPVRPDEDVMSGRIAN